MIRFVLALVALSTPALADCPECFAPSPPPSSAYEMNQREIMNMYDPLAPRRSYQPTYQQPAPPPDTRFDSYRLDNAIRQIPGWNKQFPEYGR